MAQASSSKSSTFLSLALMLSLILILTTVESTSIFGSLFGGHALTCDGVVGVKSGDTCFEIAKAYNLTTSAFDSVNPNLNCTALFVGQWVCIDGSVN